LRVDANVNLHIDTSTKSGIPDLTKTPIVEIKNMNSFRAVERAIEFEMDRQYDEWEETGATIESTPKRTFGWDDIRERTFVQREKELSADYRYFPDPDLLPVIVSEEQIAAAAASMGELPADALQRLQTQYGIKPYDADVIVSQGRDLVTYFETMAKECGDGRRASSWVQQDVLRSMKDRHWSVDQLPVTAAIAGEILRRVVDGALDNTRARDVFAHLIEHPPADPNPSPKSIVDAAADHLGIEEVDDSMMVTLCRELLAENPSVVADVKGGKQQAVGSLIGKAKKKNPNVNPKQIRELCLQLINE
ncbi:MAG: Asp-tRNA(Asn)/Glu-tRNA(Gln) amidotransferase GatCAB subunit B, partial [Planctomycetota bacterium]